MALILRRLELEDKDAFLDAINQWDNSPQFLFLAGYNDDISFEDYFIKMQNHEQGIDLPEGYVPDTALFGFIGDVIVGRLFIRHRLNDFLLKEAGHIGYGVLPDHRKKGYATEMLKASLPISKSLGIDRILVTCDDDNIGSIKTIESNGGVMENKVEIAKDKPLKRRYWIDI